jgi:hypothetical protein
MISFIIGSFHKNKQDDQMKENGVEHVASIREMLSA